MSKTSPVTLALGLLVASLAPPALAEPSDVPAVSLQDVIQRARRDPPAVLRAHAMLREAEAQAADARSRWLPALTLDASGGYGYDNQLFLPGAPRMEAHSITARGGVSFEWTALDAARGARISAADAAQESRHFALEAERRRAALLAAELYFLAAAAEAFVTDAELSVARRTEQQAATSALVEAGTRSPVDVQRAQIERLSAEYELGVRRTERRAAFAALAAAIGRSPLEPVQPSGAAAALSGPSGDLLRVRGRALAQRPELRAAGAELAASRSEHDAAVGARWPTLGAVANGSFSHIDVRAGVGLEGDQYGATAGLFLRWRGLDPAIWSQAGVTEATVGVATRELETLRHDIDSGVVQAYFMHERAVIESQRAVAVLAAAEVAREAQNGRYTAGLASLLELLDAEELEQNARRRRIEAARDEAIASARLLAAAGEPLE